MTLSPPQFDFAGHIDLLESRLVAALALELIDLPPSFAVAEGPWKETRVRMVTRAYRGPSSRIAYARFATIRDGRSGRGGVLDVGNCLCVPRPRGPGEDLAGPGAPILGIDLVAFGRDTALVVADLSPTYETPAQRAAQLESMLQWRTRSEISALPPAGPLPAWAACCLSPHALYARVGAAELAKARVALIGLGDTFIGLVQNDRPSPRPGSPDGPAMAEDAQDARVIDEYLHAHRADEISLGLLSHIFGKDWATAYRDEVLFPTLEEIP